MLLEHVVQYVEGLQPRLQRSLVLVLVVPNEASQLRLRGGSPAAGSRTLQPAMCACSSHTTSPPLLLQADMPNVPALTADGLSSTLKALWFFRPSLCRS